MNQDSIIKKQWETININFISLSIAFAFCSFCLSFTDRLNFWPFYGKFAAPSMFLYFAVVFGSIPFSRLIYCLRKKKKETEKFNFWFDFSRVDLRKFALAVFLIFGALGPLNLLMFPPLSEYTWFRVALGILSSGGFSASIILFGGRRLPLIISLLFFASLLTYTNQIDKLVSGGTKKTEANPQTHQIQISESEYSRLTELRDNTGALSTMCIIGGYVMFVYVLGTEGRRRMKYQTEIAVARSIQEALNLKEPVVNQSLRIHHATVSATDVGGDYVDVINLPNDQKVVVIADASGHGVGAGILAAITKGALKALLLVYNELPEILHHLNLALLQVAGKSKFITMAILKLDPAAGQVHIATAGHHPVLRISHGQIDEFRNHTIGLGVSSKSEYQQFTVPFTTGDSFILFTDGLIEAQNKQQQEFGKERFFKFLLNTQNSEPEQQLNDLFQEISSFTGNLESKDDMSIISIRIV